MVFCRLQLLGLGSGQRANGGQLLAARGRSLLDSRGLGSLEAGYQVELIGFNLGQGVLGAGAW